jgi:hypothetical protein
MLRLERAEASNLHTLFGPQGASDHTSRTEQGVQSPRRIGFGHSGFVGKGVY